jgi:serine/threonine protein kinase
MPLEPGSKLGQYEILSSLGAGGMGEVYRARDTELQREVAIKVLLEEVSADAERLARFEREARVLASLNHPSIATLYGFFRATPLPPAFAEHGSTVGAGVSAAEEDYSATVVPEGGPKPPLSVPAAQSAPGPQSEISFLVMELVEGDTLRDCIDRGPLPLEVAIPLFLQIADGLEEAHGKGVIHRDLKPANIKLGADGSIDASRQSQDPRLRAGQGARDRSRSTRRHRSLRLADAHPWRHAAR